MDKSLSARQVLEIRHRSVQLEGEWEKCVGTMDRHGVVFFWGNSGSGKTSAVVALCKELTRFGRVLYVSLEEGVSLSFQKTLRRFGMDDCGSRFQVITSTTIEELEERLSRQKSPEFVVIDSLQYLQMGYKRYIQFKEKFRSKLLIFVSHADGKQPEGRAAKSIKYDAGLKIWVEGYKAFSHGRFIGSTGEAVIWEKGAYDYWTDPENKKTKKNVSDNGDKHEQQEEL